MAKVKKGTVVTGVRNVKGSKKASKQAIKKAGKPSGRRASRTTGKASKTVNTKTKKHAAPKRKAKGTSTSRVKSISKARAKAAKARIQVPAPVVRVSVKPLVPQARCGARTSVQHLLRVDETVNGRTTTHLVFFDRHGWYCEHGRNCPAVGHARKHQGHIARAS